MHTQHDVVRAVSSPEMSGVIDASCIAGGDKTLTVAVSDVALDVRDWSDGYDGPCVSAKRSGT